VETPRKSKFHEISKNNSLSKNAKIFFHEKISLGTFREKILIEIEKTFLEAILKFF